MATKKAQKTGLVNSKGKAVASPKFSTQGVSVTQNTKGLSFAQKPTGLVDSKGKAVAVPKTEYRPVSVSQDTKGLQFSSSSNRTGLVDSKGRAVTPPKTGSYSNITLPSTKATATTSAPKQVAYSGSQMSSLASGTPSTPTTSVINAPNLGVDKMNTQLTFPEATVTDYSKYIPTPIEQAATDATKEKDTALKDLLKSMKNPPSSAEAYKKAQEETQILAKQQAVNDLTGQLNAVVAKGEANQLSLVGQGRGIPEAIIGGQQAQIARETAIAALPIQAQLSAAQGNLEMANDNLDTLFKIYSEDARNEFEQKKEARKIAYEIASEKEKRALDKLDKQEERTYQESQDLNDERLVYAKMAFANGQSSLGAKIAKLDYKSPTFKQDLAMLQEQLKDPTLDLDIALKQAQLIEAQNKNNGTTINPKILATSQFKAAQAAQNLKLTLEKAKAAVAKYGNYEKVSATGKGVLDSIKVQLRSEISTALEQGVVVPGEAAAFDKIAGQLNSSFIGIPNVRNNTTLASLDSLSSSMDGRIALQKSALVNTYQIAPEDVDILLNITDLTDQEFADMDALIN